MSLLLSLLLILILSLWCYQPILVGMQQSCAAMATLSYSKRAQAVAATAASGLLELPVCDFVRWRVAAHFAALMAIRLAGASDA
jgi:hypothetical protein